ncbi:c-type cytochrome [Algoriphagus namhaensis]
MRSKDLFSKTSHQLVLILLGIILSHSGCSNSQKQQDKTPVEASERYADYIRVVPGKNEILDEEVIKRGEVLISYSDCGPCHSLDKRGKGPALMDIAKRYPSNSTYINLLARKIIAGGFGSWGRPVMAPHPDLTQSDAEAMATYILSLDQN